MPALLPQQPKAEPAAQGRTSRLLTVNPLLVVSLVLALAAVLFQVPHRCHKCGTRPAPSFCHDGGMQGLPRRAS